MKDLLACAAPILVIIAMSAFALSLAHRSKSPTTKSDAPGNNKLFWTRCILGAITTILIIAIPDAPPGLKIVALLVLLACVLLVAFALFGWLFAGSGASDPMDGKKRIYDKDGNVVGYIDNDED